MNDGTCKPLQEHIVMDFPSGLNPQVLQAYQDSQRDSTGLGGREFACICKYGFRGHYCEIPVNEWWAAPAARCPARLRHHCVVGLGPLTRMNLLC